MVSDNQPLLLMNIPLEVRHHIFEYVAVRDAEPKKLLRYWFEKKEVKEKVAELAAKDPNAGAPRVVYEGDRFEQDEEHEEEDSDHADEEGEEDSSEDDNDDERDSDEDGDEEDSEEDDEEEASEDEDEETEENYADMDETDSTAAPVFTAPATPPIGQSTVASTSPVPTQTAATSAQTSATASTPADAILANSAQNPASTTAPQTEGDYPEAIANATAKANGAALQAPSNDAAVSVQAHNADEGHGRDADVDMNDDGDESRDAADGAVEEDGNHDEEEQNYNEEGDRDSDEESDEDDDEGMADEDPPLPAPVITAHRKWRHIPQFMRITHCPPPVELLLTSKQLNTEAKSWFYDVAVLRIDATASFAHTSFFEEAFSQITEAAFSPMEDIRKVEVAFVWDSTWLRSDKADCAGAIFPALLRQRASFVVGILQQAPNLSEVLIHWHDSAEDEESVDLMNDVLIGFLGLQADVKVEPHYIAADAKPYRKSVAGRRRVEFQNIVDNGLDRLF